jgi:hypothetical protein
MKLQALVLALLSLVAATASAQLPTDNPPDPGMQIYPPLYQEYGGAFALQQEYTSQLQQEMCTPPSMMYPVSAQEVACVQYRKFDSVGVESLTAGQIVEVQYVAPNSGRVSVNLRAANGDYILHADSRIKWYSWTNRYLFNSKTNGKWQAEQTVLGFPFTCPPVPTMITVRIAVMPKEFVVSVNDIILATYAFRASLTPDKVVKVECGLDDNSASIKGKVEKISVSF